MFRGNKAATGGCIEAFDRGRSTFLALGDHLGHDVGWNLQHPITVKIRRMCESHSGDMRVEGLRNGDGKIPSRVARDPMLQMDENILDHRNAPVEGARPSADCTVKGSRRAEH
jgi:hypothetical protein